MFANVWPEVLTYLLKHKNLKKSEFARKAGVAKRTVSRWATGENRVRGNSGKFAKGFGLTKGQLAYVYAWFLLRRYRVHRVPIEGEKKESEVREPVAKYDPPTALERAQALVSLDPQEVSPHMAPSLTLMRQEIKDLLEEHGSAVADLEKRLLRLVELYEKMFEGARDAWNETKELRGS